MTDLFANPRPASMHSQARDLSVQTFTGPEAFRYCKNVVRRHYENFPVGSYCAPRHLRPHIHSIYAFARHADDLADEGSGSTAERLERLDAWQKALDECFAGKAAHPVFVALANSVRTMQLPKQPFDDLLDAFRMDAGSEEFGTFENLLEYCSHSANPIGRLVLTVFGCANEQTVRYSDMLCTALQLTNFWQDVGQDILKGRVYIPLEDFDRFGYTLPELRDGKDDPRLRRMMAFQVERTKKLFASARPLLGSVPPRLRFELALTWHGGMKILHKVEQRGYDVLGHRPLITLGDKLGFMWAAFRTLL